MAKRHARQLLCAAITKSGRPCKRPPMGESKYCYIHSIGKVRNVPWHKNGTVHLALGLLSLILSLVISGVQSHQSQSSDNRIVEEMRLLWRTEEKKLLQEYPLGYELFAVTAKHIVIPYQSKLNSDFEIDWDGVAFISEGSTGLAISRIVHKPSGSRVSSCFLGISPRVQPGWTSGVALLGGVCILVKLLSTDDNGQVWVIGFREDGHCPGGLLSTLKIRGMMEEILKCTS